MKNWKSFRNQSIRGKLGLLLSLFALLAVINYTSVSYFKNEQKKDALVVNAAGRNRMLSQQIGFFAERIVRGQESLRSRLAQAVALHNTSLNALKLGGMAPGIADGTVLPPASPHIMPTLLEVEELWQKYKTQAEIIAEAPLFIDTVQLTKKPDTTGLMSNRLQQAQVLNPQVVQALKFVEQNASLMLLKNDELVKSYVVDNENKQQRVNHILLLLLVLNFALIGLTLYVIRKFVIQPLKIIQRASHHLASGDLAVETDYHSQDEIGTAMGNIKNMTLNLRDAATFAYDIEQQNFDSKFQASSENDTLGKALLQMREQLRQTAQEDKRRQWVSEGLTYFGDILRGQENLEVLANEILSALVKHMEANQGALFILNDEQEDNPYLELAAMYAWGRKKYVQKQVKPGDDILGQAWLEQEMVYLREIPEGYAEIASAIGKTAPRSLIIVPLKVNEKVIGMIELASLKEYEEYKQEFIQKVAENTASVFLSIKINQKTQLLLKSAQKQTEEMYATEEEMRQNMEELSATQEEMDRQKKEYQKVIAELRAQIKSA